MIRRAIAGVAVALCALLTGCGTYVPDGATVISVKNARQEFDRAMLRPQNQLKSGGMGIPMKWYDTNTYITTATLTPGIYKFQAHSYEGGGVQREIKVTNDQHYYEIDAIAKAESAKASDSDDSAQAGPALKGRLNLAGQRRPTDVSVLFIGHDIVMKTATVASNGSFNTSFPGKGTWRVEVHVTGNPPRSYVHSVMNVTGPVDLGMVSLK